MMAKNAEKIEQRKLVDVRRDRREIRKKAGVQFNKVSGDEALREMAEQMDKAEGILDDQRQQVEQREQ